MEFRSTDLRFQSIMHRYIGKVRDVYITNDKFISVATDRISAFDHVLHQTIPYKGQVLNQTAAYFLEAVKDIIPTWLQATPDPNVSIGKICNPYKIEMVIRGYLTGHAWRVYQSGIRTLCGVELLEGMSENDPFDHPIITPTTKADAGHDMDISKAEILAQQLVDVETYEAMEKATHLLYQRGKSMALDQGLILVDTKYEFGDFQGQLTLMDEIHTPDSSRYFYLDTYYENQLLGKKQNQLSKEFVREWLMANHFQGKDGQILPNLPPDFVQEISSRYIHLYSKVTGQPFVKSDYHEIQQRIHRSLEPYLS